MKLQKSALAADFVRKWFKSQPSLIDKVDSNWLGWCILELHVQECTAVPQYLALLRRVNCHSAKQWNRLTHATLLTFTTFVTRNLRRFRQKAGRRGLMFLSISREATFSQGSDHFSCACCNVVWATRRLYKNCNSPPKRAYKNKQSQLCKL